MNTLGRDMAVLMLSAFLVTCLSEGSSAQQTTAAVPAQVTFSGTLTDISGEPITEITGVTFLLYQNQQGGAPLWMETQNVTPDKSGHYNVVLGSTTAQGLPTDLFASGEARWLGVQAQGQAEQPRILLLSVPYALKAGDAQTLGGLPASAFLLAGASSAPLVNAAAIVTPGVAPASLLPPTASDVTTTGGTVNAVPLFTTATNVQNSILTQTGTTTINVGGKLNLPAIGAATASKGFLSRPLDFVASSFNSGTTAAVPQTFQWQAEPANNNTANPSATLNLLYGSGTTAPAETGLRIGPKGIIAFAPGQTFPGAGGGTVTGVTAGTDLTGGGSSGTVTVNLDTTKVPLLAAANAFTNANSITVSGSNPALTLSSGGEGGGLFVYPSGNSEGIFVDGGYVGIEAYGSPVPIWGTTSASNGTAVVGTASDTTATGTGVVGTSQSPQGAGVQGTNSSYGYGVLGQNSSVGYGVYGSSSGGTGVYGEDLAVGFQISNGSPFDGVRGVAHSISGNGVTGINTAQDGLGVFGSDPQGYGFSTDSQASQARSMGGWVKAMAYVDFSGNVHRCFNSQLNGSAAATPPCGMTITIPSNCSTCMILDMGFEVDDRFVQVMLPAGFQYYYGLSSDGFSITKSQIWIVDLNTAGGSPVYVFVY